jgi:hypothetical protein
MLASKKTLANFGDFPESRKVYYKNPDLFSRVILPLLFLDI